ncbi:hypothetical protein HDU93_003237 [Gonapodya sp. JEL0774]|nr:hypothetical protein HDU93_003237 [Gonapodya sp. JEL0774]
MVDQLQGAAPLGKGPSSFFGASPPVVRRSSTYSGVELLRTGDHRHSLGLDGAPQSPTTASFGGVRGSGLASPRVVTSATDGLLSGELESPRRVSTDEAGWSALEPGRLLPHGARKYPQSMQGMELASPRSNGRSGSNPGIRSSMGSELDAPLVADLANLTLRPSSAGSPGHGHFGQRSTSPSRSPKLGPSMASEGRPISGGSWAGQDSFSHQDVEGYFDPRSNGRGTPQGSAVSERSPSQQRQQQVAYGIQHQGLHGHPQIQPYPGVGSSYGFPAKDRFPKQEGVDLELFTKDIPGWLRSVRLHKYIPNLEGLDWRELIMMNEEQLAMKGVTALGARRKMLKTFEQMRLDMHRQ